MRELKGSLMVRRSTIADLAPLARLAALSGAAAPNGVYLIAEVGDELVAAAPLAGPTAALGDHSYATGEIRQLLIRWAGNLRRQVPPVAKAA